MKNRNCHRWTALIGFSIAFFIGLSASLGTGVAPAYALASTPTPPAGQKTGRLTDQSINKTLLPDAVPAIDLAPITGTYPGCMSQPEIPTLDYKTDNIELTGIAMIATCGWQKDETVKITLMDPQGVFYTQEMKAVPSKHLKEVYEVDVFFQPGGNAPEGKYRFTLQGSSTAKEIGTVKAKITFNRPKTPRMYVVSSDHFQPKFTAVGGQQHLKLQGFLPNEPVRLLAYQIDGATNKFYGWQDFTTDSSGRLVVETDLSEVGKDTPMNFFAYGRETHFVSLERFTPEGFSISRRFDMDLYCPGAQPPRLIGTEIIHGTGGTALLDIHYQPGFGSQITGRVPAETSMQVFGYPKCNDHAYWWKVYVTKPILFGWVSESFLGKYTIEAVK